MELKNKLKLEVCIKIREMIDLNDFNDDDDDDN